MLVNARQGAFVKGHKMLFNVLLCQNLARGYNRKRTTPSCIMKVDLHKAFNSVHWDFIQELFTALKFPPFYIKWIMSCISSVQFAITING